MLLLYSNHATLNSQYSLNVTCFLFYELLRNQRCSVWHRYMYPHTINCIDLSKQRLFSFLSVDVSNRHDGKENPIDR